MKFWYHRKYDMYVPRNPWWEDERDSELVEVEIDKEELVVEGGSSEPHCHAERWENEWCEKYHCHEILNKMPWPYGKYRITIEPITEEE